MLLSLVLLAAQPLAAAAPPMEARTEDFALLPFGDAVLFNNVCFKGDIKDARQRVFQDGEVGGWDWDWPESAGPSVKTYPEVLLGRSPWGAARAGTHLPCSLAQARMTLDFDFATDASGSWCESFDFWIVSKPDPSSEDIIANLTLWTGKHALEPSYHGRHETLQIGGRTYEAIFETPVDQPAKAWKTLCLVDSAPRTRGSLELGPLADVLIARGLAQPSHLLATAELGNEIAYGRGRTTIRMFRLRQ
jgi:hypothetical protein